jgi:hypothetical protein
MALVVQKQEALAQSNSSSTPSTTTSQTASSNLTSQTGNNAGEITSREETTTFKVHVNLVQVREVVQLDFTDDRVKLHDALLQLRPRPITRAGTGSCSDVSYYMADLIENKRDRDWLEAAT